MQFNYPDDVRAEDVPSAKHPDFLSNSDNVAEFFTEKIASMAVDQKLSLRCIVDFAEMTRRLLDDPDLLNTMSYSFTTRAYKAMPGGSCLVMVFKHGKKEVRFKFRDIHAEYYDFDLSVKSAQFHYSSEVISKSVSTVQDNLGEVTRQIKRGLIKIGYVVQQARV